MKVLELIGQELEQIGIPLRFNYPETEEIFHVESGNSSRNV